MPTRIDAPDTPVLAHRWPSDLDPARAPFSTRVANILRRTGYWDDPTRLDHLTIAEYLSFTHTGPASLTDLQATASAAIDWHNGPSNDLLTVAEEPWAHQIWRRDKRFADLLPTTDVTVAVIARSGQWHTSEDTPTNTTPGKSATSTPPDANAPRPSLERLIPRST